MATLPLKDFRSLVQSMVTAWATQMGLQPVFQSGDPLLAIMQSVAAQLVFIQAEVQLVNAVARAQTSTGADLDTFYGQFDFTRLPGVFSAGSATFTAFTAAATRTLIPAVTIVQTPGGAIRYQVVADTSQPTWSVPDNAYILAIGQTSLTATVNALIAGPSQNVSAGQLSQIASSLSGVDEVTNPTAIDNAVAPESDANFTARFLLYINSLSKAIKAAVIEAILSTQQGIRYLLIENENYYGSPYPFTDDLTFASNRPAFAPRFNFQPGLFMAIIDDGTGYPPEPLLQRVRLAIDAVRGFTIQYRVQGPTVILANVGMALILDPAANGATVRGIVATALTIFLNNLPLGTPTVPLTRLAQIAYDASASVLDVSDITINGVPTDLALTKLDVAKAGVVSVS